MEQLTEISYKLDSIKDQLKSEFIGLDEIIDKLIHAINPWCIMAESQTRPLLVNLWGMTGVGKTSLVKRFLELWNRDENVIHFNMGSKNYFRDMLHSMENMYALSGQPTVFIFDEFQHAKTMSGNMKEIENPLDRMIWQLMDEGKFNFTKSWHDANELKELSIGLELCLERGVKVKKGKVVEGWSVFENIMSPTESKSRFFDEINERDFISKTEIHMVHELVRTEFPFKSLLRDYLFQLDGEDIVDFLKKTEKKACMSRELDFSKSLIFVIGNLDEAYHMSNIVSADQDPDLLHEESKKITFSTIKEALKERFRMEEISRLGNIHLIYPSLSSKVYRDFIDIELQYICSRFEGSFHCRLSFSASVKDMLYEEGVTAAQGFRPLRSTIRYLMEASLVDLLQSCYYEYGSELRLDMAGDDLILLDNDRTLSKKNLRLPVREAKREKMNPQSMAITAVHEAGHTLVYSILRRRFPNMVTVVSSDNNTGGYMVGESHMDFENFDHLFRDTAIRLAGKKAEEMVFGKENITRGCETDLHIATRRLIFASREGSVAGFDAAFESKLHGSGNLLEENDSIKQWVAIQLEKAGQLAESLLEQNKQVFKTIVQLLLERNFLSGKDLSDGLFNNGIDVAELLQYYTPLLDFEAKLNEFLNP